MQVALVPPIPEGANTRPPAQNDDNRDLAVDMLEVIDAPMHGSFTSGPTLNGAFTYVPTPGYFGTDTFTYRIHTSQGYSAPAQVTINIGENPAYPHA